MPTEAAETIRDVRRALGGRRLIWFGMRGEDGEALAAFPEFAGSFSLIAPLQPASASYDVDVCLEELRGSRPEADRYDVDLDRSDAAVEFGRRMLEALQQPCVVSTYGSTALVSELSLASADTATLAGPLAARQAAFGYKPWVERALRARGVEGLSWRYIATEHRERVVAMLARGAHVLRISHGSGGVGMALARGAQDIEQYWPHHGERFMAIAPFLSGVPINFSGCVFADGTVRLHPASVQLIGIPSCTTRAFGYCGNDFGQLPERFGKATLDRIDSLGRRVGAWLYQERYLGAFGVDAIVADGEVLFTEVNPRLQGSSAVSALIARQLGSSDLFLDHLAASLGLAPVGSGFSIGEWAALQPAISHVVPHNVSPAPLARGSEPPTVPAGGSISQLAARGLPVDPGGALCCATLPRSVTESGFELHADVETLVRSLKAMFCRIGR